MPSSVASCSSTSAARTPLTTTYGSGATVTYDVDAEGNLRLIDNPSSGGQARPDVGFSYDGWGQMTTTTYDGALTSYTIDPLGRLVARAPSGGPTTTMSYRGLTEDRVSSSVSGVTTTGPGAPNSFSP